MALKLVTCPACNVWGYYTGDKANGAQGHKEALLRSLATDMSLKPIDYGCSTCCDKRGSNIFKIHHQSEIVC